MSLRVLAAILAAVTILLLPPPAPAAAGDCQFIATTHTVDGGTETTLTEVCTGNSVETTGSGTTTPYDNSVYTPIGQGLCSLQAFQLGVDFDDYCIGSAEQPAVITPGDVAQALHTIQFPAATLQVQPPNGRTLVNFETNFFTVREPFTRVVTLLGQRVELRITPTQFTWRFGDGTETTTTTPGAPYPNLQITHDYTRTGDYAPSVDTTYGAEWRLGGGAWQPVPGTVTITGAPVALEAVEAQPTLVGAYG